MTGLTVPPVHDAPRRMPKLSAMPSGWLRRRWLGGSLPGLTLGRLLGFKRRNPAQKGLVLLLQLLQGLLHVRYVVRRGGQRKANCTRQQPQQRDLPGGLSA